MTLVAKFDYDGIPLFLGDLLISADEIDETDLFVPTIGRVDNVFPKGSWRSPIGLRQKLHIIGDNIIIGWSGMLFPAKILIKELTKHNAQEPFTLESLFNFFADIDQIIGCWRDEFSFILDLIGNNPVRKFARSPGERAVCSGYDSTSSLFLCQPAVPGVDRALPRRI